MTLPFGDALRLPCPSQVIESHQKTKVDTSGTAKAVIKSFNRLGVPYEEGQIRRVRDTDDQLAMGVPEEALSGHAFHTYRLKSPDGSVTFEFQHNVRGRVVYAEGTLDAGEWPSDLSTRCHIRLTGRPSRFPALPAALFLARQVGRKAEKKLYNMIDVLEAGAMR